MSSKFNRAQYEPGLVEITLGALLSVLIGVLLCAAWLVLKPVQVVRELPKELVAGTVYFVEGRAGAPSAREWMAKSKQYLAGGSVALTETDLNSAYRAKQVEAEKAKKDQPKSEPGMITPGQLNFRINDGTLQIGAPVELKVLGIQKRVQVFMQGGFVRSGDHFVFKPETLYLGSLRADKIPALSDSIERQLYSGLKVSGDIAAAWSRMGDVKIEGAQLQLNMP